MPRSLIAALALLATLVLQAAVAPNIAIGGVAPNFLIIVVIVMALSDGSTEGAVVGFAAGLLFDLLGSSAVGPMALVLTLTGYTAGLFNRHVFAEGWVLPVTVLTIASFLSEILYLIMLMVLGIDVSFGTALFARVLPGTLYNMLWAVLLFPSISKLFKKDTSVSVFQQIR